MEMVENKKYYIQIADRHLHGVKIFDGIGGELNLPYCYPYNSKYYYLTDSVNEFKGNISMCDRGFHFGLTFKDALNYKHFITYANYYNYKHIKKYPRANVFKPIYNVTALGDVILDQDPSGITKCVTNKLQLDSQLSYIDIMKDFIHEYLYSFDNVNCKLSSKLNPLIKSPQQTIYSNYVSYGIQCLDIAEVTIVCDNKNSKFPYTTIFTNEYQRLKVINKTKYTQYVTRYNDYCQEIIPIPRHSTMEIAPDRPWMVSGINFKW